MEYNKDNIFAKILKGEVPCNKVYEDEDVLAFRDIAPHAKVHVLVIPKGEYTSFEDFIANHQDVEGFFKTVKKIANQLGLAEKGYRLVTNHAASAGQTVFHFHLHILSGQKLGKMA